MTGMRVECPSCKALVAPELAATAGRLAFTCPACAAPVELDLTPVVSPAAPASPSAAPPTAAEPSAACPKCGTARKDVAACATCGLATDRMAAFAARRDAEVPAELSAAWDDVARRWDEPAAHERLLALVAQHATYAWAAARYREATRGRPGDQVGERQLERIRRAAEATLLASANARPEVKARPYRSATAILTMLVVAAAAGMLYAIIAGDNPTARLPASTPAPPLPPLSRGTLAPPRPSPPPPPAAR
jgi:endogenous inhibitor of DNA gyrase (YacG/DUF329 family)